MNPYPPQYSPQGNYYPPNVPFPQRQRNSFSTIKILLIIFIPFLWVIAGVLPAYVHHDSMGINQNDDIIGFAALWWGWMIVGTNIFAFIAWVGNIPFWVGYFLFACSNKKQTLFAAVIVSSIACFFSFGALTVTEVEKKYSDSDSYSPSAGAFLWMFSIALCVVASAVKYSIAKKQETLPPVFIPPYYPPQQPPFPPQNPRM